MAAADRKQRIQAAKREIQQLKQDLQAEQKLRAEHSLATSATIEQYPPPPKVSERKRLVGHFGKVYAMCWAGDSEQIVSGSQDGKLTVWNARFATRSLAIHLNSAWVMTCACETQGNDMIAAGGLDNICSLYSASKASGGSDKPVVELAHHDGYLSSCKFIGADKILTASGDSTCILWDIPSGQPKHVLSDHSGDVMSVSVCPTNSNVVISGSCDSTAKLWDLRARSVLQTFTGHDSDINAVQWMNNGYCFGTGSDDSSCKIFDTRAKFGVAEFADETGIASVMCIDFSQSGRLLFAGNDNSGCTVWDTLSSSGEPCGFLNSHTSRISAVQVAPSGQAVATASWDTTLVVYA